VVSAEWLSEANIKLPSSRYGLIEVYLLYWYVRRQSKMQSSIKVVRSICVDGVL